MNDTKTIFEMSDITKDDYCVFGLATCFLKDEDEIVEVQIMEPIPSAALEAILKGIPTSYQLVCSKSLADVFEGNTGKILPEFPAETKLCHDFSQRVAAAVRTYKSRPEAKNYIPLGTLRSDLNFSLAKKRVLNAVNVVDTSDNVKQHEYTHKVL